MDFLFSSFPPPKPLAHLARIPYRYEKILPNGLVAAIFNLGGPHRPGKLESVWFRRVKRARLMANNPSEFLTRFGVGRTPLLGH